MVGAAGFAPRQFQYQLPAHCCGKLITSIGGDHEAARSADDRLREGTFKIIADWTAAAGPAQHGKTVDDDTGVDGILSGDLYGDAAPIVCAVGGQVDHIAKN